MTGRIWPNRDSQGTGLGLSISCDIIVTRRDGKADASSVEGQEARET
jgi:signal transduction histidine kinase